MGSIRRYKGKRGTTYRAEVYVGGVRRSATHDSKSAAVAWVQEAEAELVGDRLPDGTVAHAMRRYAREVAPKHKGARWEELRLLAMQRQPLGAIRMAALKPTDLSTWREARLAKVSPATVLREMNLLHSVLEWCRREWGLIRTNPLTEIARPAQPPSRKRRVTQAEIDALCAALGYAGGEPANLSQRVAVAFLFALETAMRSGEIVGLHWGEVGPVSVTLPKTKNGDAREVALSKEARRLLSLLPREKGPVFGLTDRRRDALFRKARDKAKLADLHFHDSRAEAIFRLSKKLDVMELARMIGHRNLASLMFYYQTSAAELAAKLD